MMSFSCVLLLVALAQAEHPGTPTRTHQTDYGNPFARDKTTGKLIGCKADEKIQNAKYYVGTTSDRVCGATCSVNADCPQDVPAGSVLGKTYHGLKCSVTDSGGTCYMGCVSDPGSDNPPQTCDTQDGKTGMECVNSPITWDGICMYPDDPPKPNPAPPAPAGQTYYGAPHSGCLKGEKAESLFHNQEPETYYSFCGYQDCKYDRDCPRDPRLTLSSSAIPRCYPPHVPGHGFSGKTFCYLDCGEGAELDCPGSAEQVQNSKYICSCEYKVPPTSLNGENQQIWEDIYE